MLRRLGLSLPLPWILGALILAITGCTQAPEKAEFQEALVYLEPGVSSAEVADLERKYQVDLVANSIWGDGRLWRVAYTGQPQFLGQLTADPEIAYAEPNYIYRASFVPNDPLYAQQWNLKTIGMERAWEKATGKGATVAVIDTGVARYLPDLAQSNFVRGYDFVDDDEDPTDQQGHGSHVAGTIAQTTNNSRGVAGVAYEAQIMPIRVLNRFGFGTVADISEGIRFASDRGANVINLSLGGGGDSQVLREAVDYATRKGVLVVCAAGNENQPRSSYPARYNGCLSVSATGPSGERAFYSNYGEAVDLSAPGGDKRTSESSGILQNTLGLGGIPVYASFQGTSMAAPHVAGVAALLYSQGIKDPSLIRRALLSTAQTAPDDWRNFYGAGKLRADQAVAVASNPVLYVRGGFSWIMPLSVLVLSGLCTWVILGFGDRQNQHFQNIEWAVFALAVVLTGPGLFPLEALGTMILPEGVLKFLAAPIPMWDRLLFGGYLNPFLHTVLFPGLLTAFLLSLRWGRFLALGACIGTGAFLLLQATVFFTPLMWIAQPEWARAFLLINALACLGLAYLAHRTPEA